MDLQAKHDSSMAPRLNGGLVIKHNCNQRYATSSVSATMFREFAKIAGVKVQEFAIRQTYPLDILTLSPLLGAGVRHPVRRRLRQYDRPNHRHAQRHSDC